MELYDHKKGIYRLLVEIRNFGRTVGIGLDRPGVDAHAYEVSREDAQKAVEALCAYGIVPSDKAIARGKEWPKP